MPTTHYHPTGIHTHLCTESHWMFLALWKPSEAFKSLLRLSSWPLFNSVPVFWPKPEVLFTGDVKVIEDFWSIWRYSMGLYLPSMLWEVAAAGRGIWGFWPNPQDCHWTGSCSEFFYEHFAYIFLLRFLLTYFKHLCGLTSILGFKLLIGNLQKWKDIHFKMFM